MDDRNKKTGFGDMSIRQIEYLLRLDELGNGRGAIQQVADALGIKTPTVSRFFKECTEEGYLTDDLEFTEKGRRLIDWHKRTESGVRAFYDSLGIKKGIDGLVKGAMENLDYTTLEEIVSRPPRLSSKIRTQERDDHILDISNLLNEGRHEVCIAVFQNCLAACGRRPEKSMADRGFERRAIVVSEGEERYLELTIREMKAASRIDGAVMSGRLAELKYMYCGMVKTAPIEGNKVRIPLDACTYQKYDQGIIWGRVQITVSCSVGAGHMPESTSNLLFFM